MIDYDYGPYYRPKKKGDVEKVWNSKEKYWDYNIVGGWKPKKQEFITKKKLEQKQSGDWFNDESLLSFHDITNIKIKLKKEFEDYDNMNNFKKHITLKKYAYFVAIESIFFYLYKKYPSKNVYYYNESLKKLYKNKPALDRLKYRKSLPIEKDIERLSGVDYGIVNYWIFKDSIIFKN